jgi:hypothetical protein
LKKGDSSTRTRNSAVADAIVDNCVAETSEIDCPTGSVKYVYSGLLGGIYRSAQTTERRIRCDIAGQTEKVAIPVVPVPRAGAILRDVAERG